MKSLFNSNDMEICFLANLWERARVCGVTHVDRSPIKVKLAFTLAEVLITLGIIGVVSAMTMPSLIQSTQNKELEVNGNYWIFYPFKSANLYHRHLWMGIDTDRQLLSNGLVHLTEDRAKAWALWWKTTVIDKMK